MDGKFQSGPAPSLAERLCCRRPTPRRRIPAAPSLLMVMRMLTPMLTMQTPMRMPTQIPTWTTPATHLQPRRSTGSVRITGTTLAMNCAPPTPDDPLMGAIDVEIDNATAQASELDFSAFLTIDGSSPVTV